jgi:hypothetical protein
METASITVLPNVCGDASTGVTSQAAYESGYSSGCVSVTTPFDSFIVTGAWMGYKIWTDSKCTQMVEISQVDGSDTCFVVKNGGAMAYSFTNP